MYSSKAARNIRGKQAESQLIDTPQQTSHAGVKTEEPEWVPDETKDDFWGTDWSNWKPETPLVPSDQITDPNISLIDGSISEASCANPRRAPRAERRLPHELVPDIREADPLATTDTVDRIFNYLASPPRRRRMVPDYDGELKDPSKLRESLKKQIKIIEYLVKENRKLADDLRRLSTEKKAAMTEKELKAMLWKEEEHLQTVVMMETTATEIGKMNRECLKENVESAKRAREELLDINERLMRCIERLVGRLGDEALLVAAQR